MESLFRYKRWANAAVLGAIALLDEQHPDSWTTAVRILNHTYVVDRIFRAHLCDQAHAFESTNTPATPCLAQLGQDIAESDGWYLDYARRLKPETLRTRIRFRFTDGENGTMTVEEMLTHIIVHGAYHRGNIAMVLKACGITLPNETLTRFLHLSEPERRAGLVFVHP